MPALLAEALEPVVVDDDLCRILLKLNHPPPLLP
jgi:hypothetical protein